MAKKKTKQTLKMSLNPPNNQTDKKNTALQGKNKANQAKQGPKAKKPAKKARKEKKKKDYYGQCKNLALPQLELMPLQPRFSRKKRRKPKISPRLLAIAATRRAILLHTILSQKTSYSYDDFYVSKCLLRGITIDVLNLVSNKILGKSRS